MALTFRYPDWADRPEYYSPVVCRILIKGHPRCFFQHSTGLNLRTFSLLVYSEKKSPHKMPEILLVIVLMVFIYVFTVPVILSLTLDCNFYLELKIKFYPFTFRVAQNKRIIPNELDKTDIQKKIDFKRLLSAEYRTASLVAVALGKSMKALFKSKHHYLKITLRGGFGTPDVSGFVFGLIESMRHAFGNRVAIAYYPDMVSGVMNCNLRTQAVVRMHGVLSETLFLISRLPLVEIVKTIRRIIRGDYNVRPA